MDHLRTTKPDCGAIPLSIRCNVLYTNGWCQWDDSASKCTDNFNDALFVPTVDPIISKSLIFTLYALALLFLFKSTSFIIHKMSVSRGLGKEMKLKCSVYAVEVIVGTICLCCYVHYGYPRVLLSEFVDTSPEGMEELIRGFASAQIAVFLYIMELLIVPDMRLPLILHHFGIISSVFITIPIEDPDTHMLRFMITMVGYLVTEQNVFIQLLFYRLYCRPSHWVFHFISLCFYAATRVFISILFWRDYVIWCTEIGPNQSALYYIVFAVAPILNIVLNVAQIPTVSALRHITNKVRRCESDTPNTSRSKKAQHVSAQSSTTTAQQREPSHIPVQSSIATAISEKSDDLYDGDGLIKKSIISLFLLLLGSALFVVFAPLSDAMECRNIDSFSNTIFGEQLDGILISPTDQLYDDAKYQYAQSSYPEAVAPSFILLAKSDDDIHSAIRYSKHCGYKVAVRSGGHQYSGLSSCNGGQQKCIQIDMSHFNDISVHNDTMTVEVGNTLMETIAVHVPEDTFLPHGVCHTVGVGGHWQSGGIGRVSPIFGFAIDYVVAFDIILSDNTKHSIVQPQQNTSQFNDDLFYAVLGGGPGSWGVITQFEVKPLRNDDYPDSSMHVVRWSFNKDVLRFLLQTLTKLSDQEFAYDHAFTLAPQFEGDDFIELIILYVDFPGRSVNQSVIDYIIDGANAIEKYMTMQVMQLPISQITGNDIGSLTQRREIDFPYYRKTRISTTTVSDEWINEFVDLWADFVEMDGVYGNTFFQFYPDPDQSASTFSRNTSTVSMPWRDIRLRHEMSTFYDPDIVDTALLMHQMDSAWDRWLIHEDDIDRNQSDVVLFGDGVDRRMWAFTDGDVNISSVWRYYIESEDKYNELRRIKTAVDGIDLFSNQFTIPPLESNVNTVSEPPSWSLTVHEIVAISTIGFFAMILLIIGIRAKFNFRSERERGSENELAKATMEDGRESQSEGAEAQSQSAVSVDIK